MNFALPLVILLLLHAGFALAGAYALPHLDSAMHLAGGFCLGLFCAGLLDRAVALGRCPEPGRLIRFVLLVALVGTGAVCWEVYEWLSDHYLATHLQESLDDTIKDLVLGLLGGAGYAYLAVRALDAAGTAEEAGSGGSRPAG
ncbi:MAG: hypothetical protein R3F42_06125 [Pseudomonadota bacterium]